MTNVQHIIKAASNGRAWGRFAARRYIARQCGYNDATARRVLTIALQIEAASRAGF